MPANLIQDVIDTQTQLGEEDTIIPVLGTFQDDINFYWDTIQIVKQNIGHAFTVGHATNGVIGTANGVDGSQITIGTSGLGASSLAYSTSNPNAP